MSETRLHADGLAEDLRRAHTRIKELELLGQSLLTVLGANRMNDDELVGDYGALGLDVVQRFRRALAGRKAGQ